MNFSNFDFPTLIFYLSIGFFIVFIFHVAEKQSKIFNLKDKEIKKYLRQRLAA